jgi:hypothetical protein
MPADRARPVVAAAIDRQSGRAFAETSDAATFAGSLAGLDAIRDALAAPGSPSRPSAEVSPLPARVRDDLEQFERGEDGPYTTREARGRAARHTVLPRKTL